MTYELPIIRPPSEAYSLLLVVMRGCSWNNCTFCDVYKGMKFDKRSIRPVDEVKGDIDAMRAIADGKIDDVFIVHEGVKYPLGIFDLPLLLDGYPKTAFLADSNPIIHKSDDLAEIVNYLFQVFPSIQRVTSYGRAKTVVTKQPEELRRLREAGLSRLHLGLETGDGELLKHIRKGATAEEMIEAGKRTKEAGFELSEYVMPGLGGRAMMKQHARNTARVLNEINPNFVRMRSYIPRPKTPLYEEYIRGEFQLTSPHERLREIRIMVEDLNITGRVCFDHTSNLSCFRQDGNGYKFPEEKEQVLAIIDSALKINESNFLHAEDLIRSSL